MKWLTAYARHDFVIVLLALPILLSGLFTMGEINIHEPYFIKQSIWIAIGLTIFFLLSLPEYRFLKESKFVMLGYVTGVLSLFSLFMLGHISKGAKSWISFGAFSFQPADIMKLFLIILLAKYFSRRHVEIAYMRHLIVSFVYTLIPLVLILLQPDFGSGMVVLGIWFLMVLISGLTNRHILALFALALLSFTLLWNFSFKQYQKERIINFVHPLQDVRGSGYNAYQSMIAVGSGGVYGKGLGYGTQSRLLYLPEYRTDFIFAAFAEEWGFIGSLLLLFLYMCLLARLVYFAHVADGNFEALFTYGVVIWFLIHIIINVGMNMGVMPVTGIPLPLMSYGGSHLVAEMIALSLCVSMYRYSKPAHRGNMNKEFLGLE